MMSQAVAFTAGGVLASTSYVVAAEIASNDASITTLSIYGVGAAIIGWLIRREANDRARDRELLERDSDHRRAIDKRRDAMIDELQMKLDAANDKNHDLYERLVEMAVRAGASLNDVDMAD